MIQKIRNFKFVIRNCQRGMTYVELIVVLSIFSVLSSVAIYNYGDFQEKVDIKNVGSDVALKIVEAQKSAINGVLPLSGGYTSTWKPAYGIYFDLSSQISSSSFIYFADLNNDNIFDGSNCDVECLNYITMTKGNYIDKIESFAGSNPTPITGTLNLTFKRPNSGAVFSYDDGSLLTGFDYVQITISSPREGIALIKIYPSGRIEVK